MEFWEVQIFIFFIFLAAIFLIIFNEPPRRERRLSFCFFRNSFEGEVSYGIHYYGKNPAGNQQQTSA